MAYQALYRQWRPRRFSDMIGQDAISVTLRRQVQTGRIAHAYLLSGTRGTGKTSTAQIFSRAINCLDPQDGEPCGVCANCTAILEGTSMDVEEIDAASNNGVEEIRSLRDKIKYPPQNTKYRVYIIDEVHMLSPGAFNALLKTLEEPPPHGVMILATTEPQRLPATILSRCQRFDFKRIPAAQMAGRLEEAVAQIPDAQADPDALMAIARAAEGGMRDAFSILDMCLSSTAHVTVQSLEETLGTAGRSFLFDFTAAIAQGDLGKSLTLIDRAMTDGRDAAVLARNIAAHLRSLLICSLTGEQAVKILEIGPEEVERYKQQAESMSTETILRAVDIFSKVDPEMRWAAHPRTLLELATARAAKPQTQQDLSALLQRIEMLEKAVEKGVVVTGVAQGSGNAPVKAAAPKAPAAKAAPASAPPAGDGAFWKELLAHMKKNHIAQHAALRRGRLIGREGDVVQIGFESGDKVFFDMMSMEANQALLNGALSQVAGSPVTARLRLEDQEAVAAPAPQTDWVADVTALFGRDKVEIREKEST